LSVKVATARSIDQVRSTVDQASAFAVRLVTDQQDSAEVVYRHASTWLTFSLPTDRPAGALPQL
jgi:hypothetical protein